MCFASKISWTSRIQTSKLFRRKISLSPTVNDNVRIKTLRKTSLPSSSKTAQARSPFLWHCNTRRRDPRFGEKVNGKLSLLSDFLCFLDSVTEQFEDQTLRHRMQSSTLLRQYSLLGNAYVAASFIDRRDICVEGAHRFIKRYLSTRSLCSICQHLNL